jgi:hypothetical protein
MVDNPKKKETYTQVQEQPQEQEEDAYRQKKTQNSTTVRIM